MGFILVEDSSGSVGRAGGGDGGRRLITSRFVAMKLVVLLDVRVVPTLPCPDEARPSIVGVGRLGGLEGDGGDGDCRS